MSEAIIELQKKIGAKADGDFGPNTLKAAAKFFKMSPEKAAHFFAQCAHETGEFKLFSENLNYSSEGLQKIFRKYFPTKALADQYARKPVAIASRVYANRMGNSSEVSQDGWKFRGRGALQLTGKNNYKAFDATLKNDHILADPDRVANVYAFESALFFFNTNKLWDLCETVNDNSILALTKRINGGTNGLDHRKKLTKLFYGWLKK